MNAKPTVLVLGDHTLDLFIYDKSPPKHKQPVSEWNQPLSRSDWQQAPGFDARLCLGAGATIQAMLERNGFDVHGNAFAQNAPSTDPLGLGSIFSLHRRTNLSSKGEVESRRNLTIRWREEDGVTEDLPELVEREHTWRVRERFLRTTGPSGVDKTQLRVPQDICWDVVCFFDMERGFYGQARGRGGRASLPTCAAPLREPIFLAHKYNTIVIRSSDPTRFEDIIKELNLNGGKIVLVCPLEDLDDGCVDTTGTWTTVWSHIYAYFMNYANFVLEGGKNWRFHLIIPIYADGVLWLGPDVWALEPRDQNHLTGMMPPLPPIGRLFVLPGSQPRLYSFKEPDHVLGAGTLFVFTLIDKLARRKGEIADALPDAIRCALNRVRRLHDRGYCELDELTPVDVGAALGSAQRHIPYPLETWSHPLDGATRKRHVRFTDELVSERLPVSGTGAKKDIQPVQLSGAYEIGCRLPRGWKAATNVNRDALFNLLEKGIYQYTNKRKIVRVAYPEECANVARLLDQRNNDQEIYVETFKTDFPDLFKPKNSSGTTGYELDRFAKDEIKNFDLWRRGSMQFGPLSIANPDDSGPLLDLIHKMQQHVMLNRYQPPNKGKVFSFALFGTPGSGKSTLAKEIKRAVDPQDETLVLVERNLSQFTEKQQLLSAFDEIAAQGLGGRVPLVLWDEFDTVFQGRRGGWLSQFLMPMQDARYFEQHGERPLGTAVFVFIGGTFPDARAFRRWASGVEDSPGGADGTDRTPESVLLKARDFHSRLFMTLNMPSIIYVDPQKSQDSRKTVQVIRAQPLKEDYPKLARSFFLRWLFEERSKVNNRPRTREIDEDILQILLNIPLRHGARSLERIVEACLASKPERLSRRHLPSERFLEEHIETEEVVVTGKPSWKPDPRKRVQSILDEIEKLWLTAKSASGSASRPSSPAHRAPTPAGPGRAAPARPAR